MIFVRALPLLLFAVLTFTCRAEEPESLLLSACMSSGGDKDDSVADVQTAIDQGAHLDVKDNRSGQTPLMAAVLRGKVGIVKLLLKAGADVSIPEKDGYTPAHGAGFQGRKEIMKILHEHGVNVKNDKHGDGYHPMHRACWGREKRHAEVVEYLLDIGVDVDFASSNGRTCMDMTNNRYTINILRKHGAREAVKEHDDL